MKKVYIETYGCQMNVADTEVIFSLLEKAGYERTEVMKDANVILVNTCSVRDNAEQRIWGRIDTFQKQRKEGGAVVGIVGCMAERLKKLLDTADRLGRRADHTGLACPLSDIAPDKPQINVLLSREETRGHHSARWWNGVSAFIPLRGCNNVPLRRPLHPRHGTEPIRKPCRRSGCVRKGLSDHYWGKTWIPTEAADGPEINFAGLWTRSPGARSCELFPPEPRISATGAVHHGSLREHRRHIHCRCIRKQPLWKMCLRYTRKVSERVRKIRRSCPLRHYDRCSQASARSGDHRLTLSLFREVGFDYAYMFYYSERPGTLAARKYPDDVPLEVKTRRLNEIIALQNELSLESNRRDLGKVFKVLVEGPSKKDPEELCGRTSSGKMCVFPAEGRRAGEYAHVRIESCTLIGRLV